MKKTLTFLTIIFFACSINLHSQETEQTRIEIKIDYDWEDVTSIPCGEEGVMNFYRYYNADQDRDIWNYTFFNTKLEEEWTLKYEVKEDIGALDQIYDSEKNVIYILLTYFRPVNVIEKIIPGDENKIVEIIKIDLNKKDPEIESIRHNINIRENLKYREMYVRKGNLYVIGDPATAKLSFCGGLFAGNDKESNILIGHMFSVDDREDKPLTIKNRGAKYLVLNSVVTESGNISVLVNEDNKKEKDEMNVLLYTIDTEEESILKNPIHLNKGIKQLVSQGTIMNYENNKQVFVLVTGKKKGEVFLTTGIVEDGKVHSVERNSTNKALGKAFHQKTFMPYGIGMSNRLFLSFHPKVYKTDKDGSYMIVGERTSPHMEVVATSSGLEQKLTGWTYKTAYMIKFDSEGEFQDTDDFDMHSLTFPELVPTNHLTIFKKNDADKDEHNYWVILSHGGVIHSSSMNEAKLERRQNVQEIGSRYKKGEIRSVTASQTSLWYGNCFVAYGFAEVKDKNKGLLSGADRIYYFNKIEFEARRRK